MDKMISSTFIDSKRIGDAFISIILDGTIRVPYDGTRKLDRSIR